MRLSPAAVGVRGGEVDGTVEMQGAVGVDIDVLGLEVGGGLDKADLARLHEVVGDDDVLLVRRDLDVMRPDDGLLHVGVVEALGVF